MGQVVRSILLLGMAGYTYRKIGATAAGALVVEAAAVGTLAVLAFA